MNIRRAEIKDIPRINDLLLQVNLVHHNARPDLFNIGRKYTENQLEEIIQNETTPIFVATDENDYVLAHAFCIYKQFINDNILTDIRTLYIDDICVDEKYHKQHIGRRIYEYIIAFAKENNFYNVTLNVWAGNSTAMKFYESCGMIPQKIGMETIL